MYRCGRPGMSGAWTKTRSEHGRPAANVRNRKEVIMEFKTFEEISTKYPIDGVANVVYRIRKSTAYVYDDYDLECERKMWPYGYKDGLIYHFWCVDKITWYTHYIFDGTVWHLGIEDCDGIQEVFGEEECGVFVSKYGTRATFKTEQEAEKYCKTKANLTKF